MASVNPGIKSPKISKDNSPILRLNELSFDPGVYPKINLMRLIKKITLCVLLLLIITLSGFSKNPKLEFYSLIVYRIKNKAQEEKVDQYLKQAYLPALHRA